MQSSITANTLFYGDNLPILREHFPAESVDLVYLDPPFNSNRNYSVLFRDESGKHSEAPRSRCRRSTVRSRKRCGHRSQTISD